MKRLSFLGIPIYSSANYRGIGKSVETLRNLGIAEILRSKCDVFTDLGDVALPSLLIDSGPKNLRNFDYFSKCSRIVADAATKAHKEDSVFCLGGECGLIVGALAGLRTRFEGKPGLVWLDAHGDFNTPETSPSGFVGGMGLAFACGRGPAMDGIRPPLDEGHVVHVGSRNLDPLERQAMQDSPMRVFTAKDVRDKGLEEILNDAVNQLSECEWITCHLDVDVIDPSAISAVNFPCQGGLTIDEVKAIVRKLDGTGKLKVFNLAGYNALLDANQESGKRILQLISDMFS
jgi:arginase